MQGIERYRDRQQKNGIQHTYSPLKNYRVLNADWYINHDDDVKKNPVQYNTLKQLETCLTVVFQYTGFITKMEDTSSNINQTFYARSLLFISHKTCWVIRFYPRKFPYKVSLLKGVYSLLFVENLYRDSTYFPHRDRRQEF